MPRRRKSPISRWLPVICILLVLAVGGWFVMKWLQYRKARFTRYPEFGINIPNEYEIHGIDVSRYQNIIAWEEVAKMRSSHIRLGFAFIKATEGIGNMDPQFQRNWKKSRQEDIIRGAYHFFIASKDGKMQAQNFIRRVELETGDFPPVLDVEQRNGVSKATLQKEVKEWLETAEAYYHVKPIIYTNVDFYNQNLGEDFDDYPLWVAHYYQQEKPRIARRWSFWQHSDRGNVNGITSKVDFNVFRGDSSDFRELLMP
ncbi:MAG: glycoside hydrolase family 25 protein [Chitinophagaceae bacterium]|nr:MAG: glycoside hydrolase family 25 protein [Chitinophagaceae bacterium]